MGATDENVECISVPAGASLTAADRGKWVEMSTAGQVTIANADTDVVLGVLYAGLPAAQGDAVAIAISGRVLVLNGATLANAGVQVCPDATGRNQAAVTGDRATGILMTGGMAAGEFAEVTLVRAGTILA